MDKINLRKAAICVLFIITLFIVESRVDFGFRIPALDPYTRSTSWFIGSNGSFCKIISNIDITSHSTLEGFIEILIIRPIASLLITLVVIWATKMVLVLAEKTGLAD